MYIYVYICIYVISNNQYTLTATVAYICVYIYMCNQKQSVHTDRYGRLYKGSLSIYTTVGL